jgi:hypothetical protein
LFLRFSGDNVHIRFSKLFLHFNKQNQIYELKYLCNIFIIKIIIILYIKNHLLLEGLGVYAAIPFVVGGVVVQPLSPTIEGMVV